MTLTNYRLGFLVNCLRFFAPPIALAYATNHFLLPNVTGFLSVVLYTLATPIYWTLTVQYGILAKKSAAVQAGATIIPEYHGKWPGNVDLMARYVESISSTPKRLPNSHRKIGTRLR